GRGAGGARLLGQRVGHHLRPDPRVFPQVPQDRDAGDHRPGDHQHHLAHDHHARLHADGRAVDAAVRRPDAALLRGGADDRHPVRHLLVGVRRRCDRNVARRQARRPRQAGAQEGRRRHARVAVSSKQASLPRSTPGANGRRSGSYGPATGRGRATVVRVWDLPTRLFHWALVACVIGSLVSINIGGNAVGWHFRFGYAILTLLLFRVAWGFVGPRHARFANFPPNPAAAWRYLRG